MLDRFEMTLLLQPRISKKIVLDIMSQIFQNFLILFLNLGYIFKLALRCSKFQVSLLFMKYYFASNIYLRFFNPSHLQYPL